LACYSEKIEGLIICLISYLALCLKLAVKINIKDTAFLYRITHSFRNSLLRLRDLLTLLFLGRLD
jgi:hypothetical protein